MKIFNENEIDELVKILENDGIIAVPTDTVYGLCAKMDSIIAHDKLIALKNRPKEKLFPIMCANIEQIKSIAYVDEKTEKIIKAFMPGPITLILNCKSEIKDFVNNNGSTIAVRMATSEVLEKIIVKLKSPIFMSSANKSGEEPCSSIAEIENTFQNIDGILNGKIIYGKASTIVDCTLNEFKILREGPISKELLNKKKER